MKKSIAAATIAAVVGLTGASASGQVNFDFSDPVPLAASQTAGAWYTDRYAPGEFDSFNFNGEQVLRHGIRDADSQANRPAAFSGGFYNFQGRKYDLGLGSATESVSLSIDLWVDATWEGADRNAGIWATGRDANGAISAYPIMAFRNDGISTFDYLDGGDGTGWVPGVSLSTGDFGNWFNLSFTLTPGVGVEYFVNGVSLGTFADTNTTMIDNVILNGFNFGGEDYDIYWDNFTAQSTLIPLPGAAGMALAGMGLIGLRRRR